MSVNFEIQHGALHLIDKEQKTPQLANQEIKFSAFSSGDQQTIKEFFSGHIDQIWEAVEATSVRAANFAKSSQIQSQYNNIAKSLRSDPADPSRSFLSNSRTMAQALFDVTPSGGRPGLLMTLWLRVAKSRRPFLALFKMDPGRTDKVVVASQGDQLLLDLAVQHIERTLPEPANVLKWAISPHPTRAFDVKIKDLQNPQEPAQYFMKFLGCVSTKSEKVQINDLAKILGDAAAPVISEIVLSKSTGEIDSETVEEAIEKSSGLASPQKERVRQQVQAAGFLVRAQTFQALKVQYELDNKITIRGPRAPMEGITITRLGKDRYEFRISTTGYEKEYLR